MQGIDPYQGRGLIADPIHRYILYTRPDGIPGESTEQDLIDSAWMQRLRRGGPARGAPRAVPPARAPAPPALSATDTSLAACGLAHEKVGQRITREALGDLLRGLTRSPSGPFEPGEAIDPDWICYLLGESV